MSQHGSKGNDDISESKDDDISFFFFKVARSNLFFHASGLVTCAGAPGKRLFASFTHRQRARQRENPATELRASPIGFFNPVITTEIFTQSRNPDGYSRDSASRACFQCVSMSPLTCIYRVELCYLYPPLMI